MVVSSQRNYHKNDNIPSIPIAPAPSHTNFNLIKHIGNKTFKNFKRILVDLKSSFQKDLGLQKVSWKIQNFMHNNLVYNAIMEHFIFQSIL